MRRAYWKIGVIVLLIFLASCTRRDQPGFSGSDEQQALKVIDAFPEVNESPSIRGENLRVVEIALPGMFCGGCAYGAEYGFNQAEGVVWAEVNLREKRGTVIYDPAVTSKDKLVQNVYIQAFGPKILQDIDYVPSRDEKRPNDG